MRWIIVTAFSLVVWNTTAAGYLPRFGPAPLRFAEPPAPMVVLALPPLKMMDEDTSQMVFVAEDDAPPPSEMDAVPPGVSNTNAVAGLDKGALGTGEPVIAGPEFVTTKSGPISVVTPPHGLGVTAEMLVPFFRGNSTNNAASLPTAIVPVQFAPPLLNPPPPSSTATYSTKPQ